MSSFCNRIQQESEVTVQQQLALVAVCHRYCQRLNSANFWGGEVELLVLSKMLHTPIYVYKTAQEGGRCDLGSLSVALREHAN